MPPFFKRYHAHRLILPSNLALHHHEGDQVASLHSLVDGCEAALQTRSPYRQCTSAEVLSSISSHPIHIESEVDTGLCVIQCTVSQDVFVIRAL